MSDTSLERELEKDRAIIAAIRRVFTEDQYKVKREVQFQMLRDILDILDGNDRGQKLINKV